MRFLFRRSSAVAVLFGACFVLGVVVPQSVQAQADALPELTEDEQRQVKIAERFLTVLEKRPRRGTALDRVYGHHVEYGTLDEFLEQLQQRVKNDPQDGAGWMLLGLFEAHRGEDANAVDAFLKAEELRPEDAMAAWYRGQSLLLLGQPEQAVLALEVAISRKPPRADLLPIFQQLGRIHQRAQRDEKALDVWNRLEALFPDDVRVQEQIASTLVEEGEHEQALPRYEKLSALVKDDYRRTIFRMQVAELKVQGQQRDAGLQDFEQILGSLNPDSWLHRDVRRRIEDVFLRSGDQDGLVAYYEAWISQHPEDVDAMARVARFLARSARMPEARKWMNEAIRLAPGRAELRRALIDQLKEDQLYAEAAEQYRLLEETDPGNPDVIREWGRTVLKDKTRPKNEREAAAREVWNRMTAARPEDAVTAAQVADFFRQVQMQDDALRLYQQAVTLAPDDPQYREYLGEYYHILKRPEEAVETWQQITAGERGTAANTARLAEVYQTFGYPQEAAEQIAISCELDDRDFALMLRSAEYHTTAEQHAAALQYLDQAAELARLDEEHDAVINQRIQSLRAAGTLGEAIDALEQRLAAEEGSSSDWHLLARFHGAGSDWTQAVDAIGRALALDARSIPCMTTAARLHESAGDPGKAIDIHQQLADVDRRQRGDHLMSIARLNSQMGRTEAALQAGRDLIVSAPGNTDHYEFYSQLCMGLGKTEEGLNALRKAVRINPTEPHLTMALGGALASRFRADEAIQVYWQAFEKSDEIEDLLTLTQKLTELYLQLNQLERILERFERDRREDDQRRNMTLCLAQAHQTAGDIGAARGELESLLTSDTRDTNLLQQISKLCESSGDLQDAIDYQRQLNSIAPGQETEFRLAGLLNQAGDVDQATEIYERLTRQEEDPVRQLRSVDRLLGQESYDSVLAIIEPLLRERTDDWELLYRQAVCQVQLKRTAEACESLRRILELRLPVSTLGRHAEQQRQRALAKNKSARRQGHVVAHIQNQTRLMIGQQSHQVRQACGLENHYYGHQQQNRFWGPDTFGLSRLASLGWLLRLKQDYPDDAAVAAVLEPYEAAGQGDDASSEQLYDALDLGGLQQNHRDRFQVLLRLARRGGDEEKQHFLRSLGSRHQQANRSQGQQAGKQPLEEDVLQFVMECYRELEQQDQERADAPASKPAGPVMHTNGVSYVQVGGQWVPMHGRASLAAAFTSVVKQELELAGRDEEAAALVQQRIANAEHTTEILTAMQLLMGDAKAPLSLQLPELYERWHQAAQKEIQESENKSAAPGHGGSFDPLAHASHTLLGWMGRLGAEEEHRRLLEVLDSGLDLAIEVQRIQRKQLARQPRGRRQSSQQRHQWGFSLMQGQRHQYIRVSWPMPGRYASQTQLSLLRGALEILKGNNVQQDLLDHLQQRVANADEDRRRDEQMMLAWVYWWNEEPDEAVDLLQDLAPQVTSDPAFLLEIAGLQLERGDIDAALELTESVVARDRQLLQRKEILAMTLAERAGDVSRARQAAERLFGLRLTTDEQLGLATVMRRIGLSEMAENVLARVHRRGGNQASSLPVLMAQYQAQGHTQRATQIAHRILRSTQNAMVSLHSSRQNPYRWGNRPDNSTRQSALRVLQQTGDLKKLEERLTKQLERSPGSARLYGQLMEVYEISGRGDELTELLVSTASARPDDPALQLKLAKHYQESGKVNEACDCYLTLLRVKPSWLADDMYRIRQLFQQSERTKELLQAFQEIDLKKLGQVWYLQDLAADLLRQKKNEDLALTLLERVAEAYPRQRANILGNFYDKSVWKNDRLYQFGKTLLLPQGDDLQDEPWFGFNQIRSYSGDGRVNGPFQSMLQGVANTPNGDDLKQAITELTEQFPDWHAGRAMLAVMDLHGGNREQARESLKTLLEQDGILDTIPGDTCRLLGQELDEHEATQTLALELYLRAQKLRQRYSGNQLRYTVVPRLVKLHIALGQQEDARRLLSGSLSARPTDRHNQPWETARWYEDQVWVADQLLELGSSLDALLQFQQVADSGIDVNEVEPYISGSGRDLVKKMQSGMERALASITGDDREEAVTRLLGTPDEPTAGQSLLDLKLVLPGIGAEELCRSRLVETLQSLSTAGEIRQAVTARLSVIREQHPEDISACVLRAVLSSEEDRADTAQALLAVLNDHPLDEIPEGRRPNNRQRRQAAGRFAVWLVARQCLQQPALQQEGKQLAELALQAALRQRGDQHIRVLLMEWAAAALEAGDKAEAERRWSQLLDVITEVPADVETSWIRQRQVNRGAVLTAYAEQNRTNTPSRRMPLTMSRFSLAREIAVQAAKNGMSELSRRAVQRMLAGGAPVPDVATATNGRRAPQGGVTLSGQAQGDTSASDQVVADALIRIVKLWDGPEYPADEVCDILQPVLLPANRPGDILLYASSDGLIRGQLTSGAEMVLRWSQAAGRLGELRERILARMKSPSAEVPGRVLLLRIALLEDDLSAAADHLTVLSEKVHQGAGRTLALEACHAALPAFDYEPLQAEACRILQYTLKLPRNDQGDTQELNELHRRIYRYLCGQGRQQEVEKSLEDYLVSRNGYYSRYGGDYGLYVQAQDWGKVAREAALVGATETALNYIGRARDFKHERYSPPGVREPVTRVLQALAHVPAGERYQQLRDWTLPAEGRNTIRYAVAHVPVNRIPDAYLSEQQRQSRFPQESMLSNIAVLLDAAEEADQLDELRQLAQQAWDDEVPDSMPLLAMVLLKQGDVDAAIELLTPAIRRFTQRHDPENKTKSDMTAEGLLWTAAMQHPDTARLYQPLLQDVRLGLWNRRDNNMVCRIDTDHSLARAKELGGPFVPDADPGLVWWTPSATSGPRQRGAEPWWVRHEDKLVHLHGTAYDQLIFNPPLSGDFEFSVDCSEDHWAEADLGFNGVIPAAQDYGSRMRVSSFGHHERFRIPLDVKRRRPGINRARVRVRDGQVQFVLNNHQVWQEPVSPTAPWLLISTVGQNQAAFTNMQMTGTPEVLSEVTLIHDNLMEGWNTQTFSETQPRHRLMAETPHEDADWTIRNAHERPQTDHAWYAQDGILHGRARSGGFAQSWAYYFRPLGDGETVSCEFFYMPGGSTIAPSLGRVAWLLEPDQLKTHWIATSWDQTMLDVEEENTADAPGNTLTPGPLPLRAGEWNQLSLSLNGDTVTLHLNDVAIYNGPAPRVPDTRFGFYRDRRQSARIRNVVLSGPWQEQFRNLTEASLLETRSPVSPQTTRIHGELIRDSFSRHTARQVSQAAQELSDEDAWQMLSRWVLPPQTHRGIRFYYEHLSGGAAGTESGALDTGPLACPAIDLINVAKRLGRLDQLAQQVDELSVEDQTEGRDASFMLALIDLADGYPESAYAVLEERHPVGDEIFAETLLCRAGARFEDLQEIVRSTVYRIIARSHDNSRIRHDATATLRYVLQEIDESAPEVATSQWTNVPDVRLGDSFVGRHSAAWKTQSGVVEIPPTLRPCRLYFQSPLQGTFEVEAQCTLHETRSASIAWGGFSTISAEEHRLRDVARMRLRVKDGAAEIRIHREDAEEDAGPLPQSPWLALLATPVMRPAVVQGIRITGNPTIPDELDLIRTRGTALWAATRFSGTDQFRAKVAKDSGDHILWTSEGDQLIGRLQEQNRLALREGLLTYQRPVLEDGVISFESWYQTGRTEVHPAIGDVAFLLASDGVDVHEITDGEYEQSGRAVGNRRRLVDSAETVPLRENDWNRVTLTVQGNTVSIAVNDTVVGSHELTSPPEQRFLGLFRYVNKTEAKVRNMTWRGEWPKQLPALEDQILAGESSVAVSAAE